MRYRLLAAIAILFPLAVQAQAPQNPPSKASVSGIVIDTSNNQGLRKATVTLTVESDEPKPRAYTATSATDGTFSISDIEPGRYRLSLEHTGFVPDRKARKMTIMSLGAGQSMSLQVPMLAAGVVTGRVLDKDGDPLPQTSVQVLRKGRSYGSSYISPSTTNDMGEYRIFQVPPGSYYVAATVDRDQVSESEIPKTAAGTGYVPMYYPGSSDFTKAVAVDVKSGSEVRADFTMIPGQVFEVRGKILTPPGERADYTHVMIHPSGNLGVSSGYSTSVNQDGTFQVGRIAPGSYLAIAMAVNLTTRKQRTAYAKFEIAEADVEGLVLNLSGSSAKVRGRILVEGKPAFDVSQLNLYLQSAVHDDTLPRYVNFSTGAADGYTNINRDGSFVMEVMPGSYFPEVFSQDAGARDYYVKAIHYGSKDISDSELVIGEAGSAQSLEILVGSGGQSVTGVVQDSAGKPAADATVVAFPDPKRRKRMGSYDSSMTDQAGRFALRGLQPGEYTLLALDDAEEGLVFDPEFLSQFESKGLAFRARERGRDTVTLNLVAVDNP